MGRYIGRDTKHPLDTEAYDFPFGDYLTANADAIDTFAVEKDAGLGVADGTGEADAPALLADQTTVRVFVYAGEDGVAYDLVVAITTVAGRIHRLRRLVKVRGEGVADAPVLDAGDVDTEYTLPTLDDGDIDDE